MDTDTLIVNESTNLIDLIPPNQLLAAQRVYRFDWRNSWDINAGVTLWNLKHPLANTVMKRWKRLAQFGDENQDSSSHRLEILSKNDDQYVSSVLYQNSHMDDVMTPVPAPKQSYFFSSFYKRLYWNLEKNAPCGH